MISAPDDGLVKKGASKEEGDTILCSKNTVRSLIGPDEELSGWGYRERTPAEQLHLGTKLIQLFLH